LIEGFGCFLEQLRGNLSLREAAKLSGLSHAYIRDLELEKNRLTNDRIIPSPDTLKKLSIAYRYSYKELMIMAGHLTKEEKEIMIHLPDMVYAKIDSDHIEFRYAESNQVVKRCYDLLGFHELLQEFDQNHYKRMDTVLYVNLKRVRGVDMNRKTLHFDHGFSLRVSPLRLNKYEHAIARMIAEHSISIVEFNVSQTQS
jgi:transcriptional regulator with XRE-family HTH domain